MYRVLSTAVASTGVPKDSVVNTFHVANTGDFLVGAHFTPITDAWQVFMRAIASQLGGLATTGHSLRFYHLDDPIPRAPRHTGSWTFSSALSACGPREIAVTLSYRGAPASGEVQARRRGRMYMGPMVSSTVNNERPLAATRNQIGLAGQTFINTVNAIAGAEFVIFSRVNNEGTPVAELWTDDAWDVQRRRGNDPTAKAFLPVTSSP